MAFIWMVKLKTNWSLFSELWLFANTHRLESRARGALVCYLCQ